MGSDSRATETSPANCERTEPRRPYSKPWLVALGDVRDLTLGGTAGALDSGAADVQQPPGGLGGGS
jgi:hypothetical protein